MKTMTLPWIGRQATHPLTDSALLDLVMPLYEVRTRRTRRVRAAAPTLYAALDRALTAGPPAGYAVLLRRPGRELLLGSTRLWTRGSGEVHTADAWCAYQGQGSRRTTVSLRVVPVDYQTADLIRETRVHSRGLGIRLLTRLTWPLIVRLGRRNRRSLLRQVAVRAEHATGLFRLTP
ncbi:MAG: hypothetical protein M3Z04_17215 [Chloroflexota bacterium]|nr:hypothetical protein [Chloroflexota bacterium]